MYEAELLNLGTRGIRCQERQITSFTYIAVGKHCIPLRGRYLIPSNWAFSAKNGVVWSDQVDCIAGQYLFYYYVTGDNYYLLLEPVWDWGRSGRGKILHCSTWIFVPAPSCVRASNVSWWLLCIIFFKSSPYSNFFCLSLLSFSWAGDVAMKFIITERVLNLTTFNSLFFHNWVLVKNLISIGF